ncbi:MAG TPA: aldo/keto reductase [Candidatus Obscuribacterales bacterium]
MTSGQVKTNNGAAMPAFIYGTAWKKSETARLTELAVDAGFRGIDTANQLKHYDEALVGEALKHLAQKGIKRESLFLQTKFTSLDGQDHRVPYDPSADFTTQVKQSMDSSLAHLHTDYVDSYLLHGPFSWPKLTPPDLEVWSAIEQLYRDGKTRIIGVSNFTSDQLDELCREAAIKPMIVQNRCYASAGWDRAVREICKANGIIYQGFSLLTANTRELAKPAVHEIASRIGATIAQTVFCFAIRIGMVALTGTTNAQHMREDLQSHTFPLTDADMRVIEAIGL